MIVQLMRVESPSRLRGLVRDDDRVFGFSQRDHIDKWPAGVTLTIMLLHSLRDALNYGSASSELDRPDGWHHVLWLEYLV